MEALGLVSILPAVNSSEKDFNFFFNQEEFFMRESN